MFAGRFAACLTAGEGCPSILHLLPPACMRLFPFRALRPPPKLAAAVAAVPYDVVDRREAALLAEGNAVSFLHVTRPEIDLPDSLDPHDEQVYDQGRRALEAFVAQGTLVEDPEAALYIYRLEMGGRAQVGIVGCVEVEDYANDTIRKHEKTRRDKEDDRTRHLLTLGAHPEPVFLAYRPLPALDSAIAPETTAAPLYDFTAPDGVRHTLWRVRDTAALVDAFSRVPVSYVADGHHRCASAWRAGTELRAANRSHAGNESYNRFPAVLFSSDQLRILPYNRVVRDLNGLGEADFLTRLAQVGKVEKIAFKGDATPSRPHVFHVFLPSGWYRLTLDSAGVNQSDPVGALDVSLLQERVLTPILGVGDPRTDQRIDFVGGIRGTEELERRVRQGGMAVAFALHPTSLEQLLAVADAGGIMPPKSTWFEPKLRSGLFVHVM